MSSRDYKTYQEITNDKNLDAAAKRKKVIKLFTYLKGGKSDKEAFELALRRDRELQKRQLETMFQIRKSIRHERGESRVFPERREKVQFLHDTEFVYFLIRYLQVDAQNDEMFTLPNTTAPWKAGKYYGLEAMSLLFELSFLYRDDQGRNERFEEYARNGLFMQAFYAYIKLGDHEAIIRCALAEIIFGTAMQSELAMEQFFRKGPMEVFAKCLRQDIPPQYMNDWYRVHCENKPMPEWEEEVVRNRPNGCVCFPRQEELKKYKDKTTRDLVLKWGCTLRDGVMRVLAKIKEYGKTGDQCRRIVLGLGNVMKDLLWWLQSIPLSPANHDSCKMAFYGINAIGESEWAADTLLSEYDLMRYVEVLLYSPHLDIVCGAARLVCNWTKDGNYCLQKIADNKLVLRALILMTHSFVDRLQFWALDSLIRLTKLPEVVGKLEKLGFGLRELITMVDFFPTRSCCCDIKKIKDNVKRTKYWRSQSLALREAKYNHDVDRAQLHIQRAESFMQQGKYAEALELLRQANVSCPPSEMIPRSNMIEWGDFDAHDCEEIKDSFPYDDFSLVPGKIRVLKTKCYMKMKQWKKALSAAEEAMFRLFEAQDCMDKGRTAGTLFNEVVTLRYEIYTELNHPYKAMRDAAYLCVLDQENKQENVANWLNLQRAQIEYECKYGYNLLPRCSMCFKGDGCKILQCFNCGSMYCSDDCQEKSWDYGHKEFCETRRSKLLASKHKKIIPSCRDIKVKVMPIDLETLEKEIQGSEGQEENN